MDKTVEVKVPCSTSNLGPGLDCLGLALSLYIQLRLTIIEAPSSTIQWLGEGEDSPVVASAMTLIEDAAGKIFKSVGMLCPKFEIKVRNDIPLRAGLGSSGAIIVATLMAANRFCDDALSSEQLITLATEIEGHPDNVSPALFGGLTVSYNAHGQVIVDGFDVPEDSKVAVLLPTVDKAGTAESRKDFPKKIALEDAIFNQGRTAAIVAGLISGKLHNGRQLFQDRIHQERRGALMPWLFDAIEAACDAGALGAFLSGAGPAIGAFSRQEDLPIVLEAMDNTVAEHGIMSRRFGLNIAQNGAEYK